eukprot:TRINITY_DN40393_c0_g1_i1.p1 TRINITY_DN40393_c0_g1~~TRINITY_DN40393_c0_g1_i1.p1  ORF type:complete len:266 (-),score=30.78 TRINITY_DN40393_c0_g1_i1:114-809(-)
MANSQWNSWGEVLADHSTIVGEIPKIFGGYVGPNALEPKVVEAAMLTVNSYNACPFCTDLHCELGRMAGVDDAKKLNCASSEKECRNVVDLPEVTYARIFAESAGRGEAEANAYQSNVKASGQGAAASLRAMCWFLHWGSYTGNTLNSIIGRRSTTASMLFKITFFAYYCILFWGIVSPVSFLVSYFPKVPKWFSACFGVVLITVASIWLLPLGLMALVCGANSKRPLAEQ